MFQKLFRRSPTKHPRRVQLATARRMQEECDYLMVELDSQITQLVSAARYIDNYDRAAVPVRGRGGTRRTKMPRAPGFSAKGNAHAAPQPDQTRQQVRNVMAADMYAECLQSAKDCIVEIMRLKAEGVHCGLAPNLEGLPIPKLEQSNSIDSQKLVGYAKTVRKWHNTVAGRTRTQTKGEEAEHLLNLKKELFGDAMDRARRAKSKHNTV